MRQVLLIGLASVVLMSGCKKASNKLSAASSPTQPTGQTGGVIQGVHNAVKRTVTEAEMHDLHILIESSSGATGRMPSAQDIMAALQQSRSPALKKVQEGSIVLTGTRSRESIWAYTKDIQTAGGHFILTSSGIERLSAEQLRQRLQQQGL